MLVISDELCGGADYIIQQDFFIPLKVTQTNCEATAQSNWVCDYSKNYWLEADANCEET